MKKLMIFALVIWCKCTAQQLDLSNISTVDSFFTALASSKKAMGTVSVFKDGNPVYQKLLGFRDSTASGIIMPDDNTKYRIGSLSKMFTAVMIMQLSEEGKINIDSPLSVFFSQIINARSITIRQMLDHHSGLPRYEMTYDPDRLKEAENETELVEKIANKAGDMEDQDKGHYSI